MRSKCIRRWAYQHVWDVAFWSVTFFLFSNVGLASDGWKYDPHGEIRPTERVLALEDKSPSDIDSIVSYRGSSQLFGQLRYGSENSRRVTIVVDRLDSQEFDLYVDLDRDREITQQEFVAGSGRSRSFPLDCEIVEGDEAQQTPRRLRLRLQASGNRMSVATLGFIEGEVSLQKFGKVKVRRTDRNANGLFSDSRDRLLLDLDGNQKWHPIHEQFAYLPVLKLDSMRLAVRSDRMGERLSLEPITGIGQLTVEVSQLPEDAQILGFEAIVYSDDGSAYAQRNTLKPLSVPVGAYTLGSVTLTIKTKKDKKPWHFVFSRYRNIKEDDWTVVKADQSVSLEAVGKPSFSMETKKGDTVKPGEQINISPRFYTEHGLLISLSARGDQMGSFDFDRTHNRCTLELQSPKGKTLSTANSGFA